MKQVKVLRLHPYNHTFGIYDANLAIREVFHEFTKQTIRQGFSRRPGSYNFYSLGSCPSLTVEVWLACPEEEVALKADTVRVIMVPFSVSEEGVMISDLLETVKGLIQVPVGEYALVFEIRLRNDPEYLSSSEYQKWGQKGYLEEWCYMTFYPIVEPIQPEVLRVDIWTFPPPDSFEEYWALNPTYPLSMEVGLA